MNSSYDVPDSTDWLETPLKDFADLENALHCQICKEFYDTPMITSCNHTFCSKCIRTSLSADGKCPACRTSDQASKLRNNWALQEVVSTFLVARPPALAVARQAQEEAVAPKQLGKRKRAAVLDSDDVAEAEPSGRTTRSKSRRIAASQESQPEPIEIADSDEDMEAYEPEPQPDDGLVECPLGCGKRMKEVDVFGHLDKCEDEKKQASKAKSRTAFSGLRNSRPASDQKARPQDRINELNYSMTKDVAFKKKLKELGIPDWGNKQLMIQRHREWVNIWNANCDSTQPKSKGALLKDLDIWERTQGGRAPSANGLSSTIMKKDFDGQAYSRRHQDDFSRLIADAKRKKANPATETKSSKDEETVASTNGESDSVQSAPQEPAQQQPAQQEPAPEEAGSQRPASQEQLKPYEINAEALSSIRKKVEALNRGETIEPVFNQGFKAPTADDAAAKPQIQSSPDLPTPNAHDLAPPPSSQQQGPPSIFNETIIPPVANTENGLADGTKPVQQPPVSLSRDSSRDEHSTHEHTGTPCDIATHLRIDSPEPPKQVPMFSVPAQPVRDIDGGGGSIAAP